MIATFSRADTPALDAARLAASNAIDMPVRRRNPDPERAMRWVWRGFWAAFWLTAAALVPVIAAVAS